MTDIQFPAGIETYNVPEDDWSAEAIERRLAPVRARLSRTFGEQRTSARAAPAPQVG